MKTKTRFHKLTAWLLTVAMLMTFIPGFTLTANAATVEATWGTSASDLNNEGTLTAAIAAKPAYIQLQSNVSMSSSLTLSSITTTLDLNGNTLSNTAMYGVAITLNDNADLTIIDSAGGGQITATNTGAYGITLAKDTAKLTVESGTISGSSHGIRANNGTAYINGGSITSKANAAVYVYNTTMTITGGTINSTNNTSVYISSGIVNISGGTITGNSYAVNGQGGKTTITGGSFTGSGKDIYLKNTSVDLTLGYDTTTGEGASFPDGLTVSGYFINTILAEGAAYYDADTGEKKTVNDLATAVTGNVIVKGAVSAPVTYTVTIDENITNGTVESDVKEAAEGDTVTLTVTPAEGYELDTLTVKDADDNDVTVTDNKFTMPAKNVTVSATFKAASQDSSPVGDGTAENPYQITTAEELYWFANKVNGGDGDACAKLMNDIEVNEGVLGTDGTLNDGTFTPWTPIGDEDVYYTGTFDGNNCSISGLYSNGFFYAGLFGYIDGGCVKNLTVSDSYFNVEEEYAGSIAAYNDGGEITGCHSSATVSGGYYLGGIIGGNGNGTVSKCSNSGKIAGGSYTGGIVGSNEGANAEIENCYNTGGISGAMNVGGIAGYNSSSATTQNCYNTGSVSGTSNAGGIVGSVNTNPTIQNCYYLFTSASVAIGNMEDTEDVTAKSDMAFASGAVAYLLNGSSSENPVWYQTLAGDDAQSYPRFAGSIVYYDDTYGYNNGHIHNWTYNNDGATITATCTADDCPDTDGGSIIIAAPESLVYTGSAIEAKVTNTLTTDDTVTVVYTPADNLTDGKPVNAGEYTATITLDGKEISVTYEIYVPGMTGGSDIIANGDKTNAKWDYIYFGTYNESPIKWRVLSKNGNGGTYKDSENNAVTNAMFLLSEYGLANKHYEVAYYQDDGDGQEYPSMYEHSDMQIWLNGDFTANAFTDNEKQAVLKTTKTDAKETVYDIEWAETKLEDETAFLISTKEAYDFISETTGLTSNLVAYTADGTAKQWWLRSNYPQFSVAVFDSIVAGGMNGGYTVVAAYQGGCYVRPAINLHSDNILFTSAAVGSKAEVFGEVTPYNGNEYKLTVKDSTRSGFTAEIVKTADDKLHIFYTGAKTGDNEYISAIVKNADGDITHYGRLGKVTAESGSIEYDMSAVTLAATDKLYIFNEQYNGDYKTDFASELKEVTIPENTNAYYVTFDANGGSGTMEKTVASEEYTLPECTFTAPADKTFYGWATSANGEVIKSKTYTVTQDTTFYPVWGEITEVKYTTDDGVTWNFDSLMDAIWSYGADVEIKLLKDITLTSSEWSYAPVFANANANVTIDGQGHTITRGNGVGIFATIGQAGSTLTLKNITIDGGAVWSGDNPATRTNSGYSTNGYYYLFDVYNGTLVLDDGAVIQNAHLTNEDSYGGAISVSQSGAVIMNDGAEIKDCTAGSGGGVCVVASTASFTMNGGNITGCYATSGGGAVLAQGAFTMNDGELSNNASGNNGGAVTVSSNGVFTLVDGAIRNNASVVGGGAITILAANSILNLKGGEISGNTITGTLGGGILVNNGTFNLSGAPIIKDNLSGTKASNVYLGASKVINISDVVSNTTKIGITMKSLSVFTSGWDTYMNGKAENDYFVSDDADSYIANNGTELVLKKNISLTVTDTEQIYTGEAKNITLSANDDNLKTEDFTIKYYKINENEGKLESVTAVTNAVEAGKYLYVITFADSSKEEYYTILNKLDKTLDTNSAVSAFTSYGNTGIFTIKTGITGQQTPIYFDSSVVNAYMDTVVENKLNNSNASTVTYESKNTDVAEVDKNTGAVYIKGSGSAVIIATSTKDETTPVYASYTLNVTKEVITVTANDVTVSYGTEKSAVSNGYTVSKDGVTLDGTATYAMSYDKGTSCGLYDIEVSGLTSDIYDIVFEKGTLTVTPKEITLANLTINAEDKVYDASSKATVTATVNADALVSGDIVNVLATGTFDTANASDTDKEVSYTVTGLSGTHSSNYKLTGTLTGVENAKITKAPVTVSVPAKTTYVYDGEEKSVNVIAYANGLYFDKFNVTYTKDSASATPKEIGTYAVGVEITDTNYVLSDDISAEIIIKEAQQDFFSIEGIYDNITYGDPAFNLQADGVESGATVKFDVKSGSAATVTEDGTVTITGVGSVTVEATSELSNHTTKTATRTFTVKPKTLNVLAAPESANKVYDGTKNVSVKLTLDGVIEGDKVQANYANATMVSADVEANKTVFVNGITLSGDKAELYQLSSTSVQTSVNVTKREIKGVTLTAEDKVYNGNAKAEYKVTALEGVVSGEEDFVTVVGNASFADEKAGTNKVVTLANPVLSGSKSGNYALNITGDVTANADIEKATVDFTLGTLEYTYDGYTKTVPVSATVDGVAYTNYTVAYQQSGAVAETKNAGEYDVVITLNDTTNYKTNYTNKTLKIVQASQNALTITGLIGTIDYGATFALSAVGGSGNGNVTWTSSNSDIATVDESTGVVTITGTGSEVTITATKAADGNYQNAQTATVTFTPAKKSVGFKVTNLNQTYDGNAKSVTVTPSVGSDNYVISYTDENGSAVINPTNAGIYYVDVNAKENSGYDGYATAVLTIKNAAVDTSAYTFSVADAVYGTNLVVTKDGTLPTGVNAVVTYTGSGIYTETTTEPTNAGSYVAKLTISGANFDTVVLTDDFVITKAELTATPKSVSRAYGAQNPVFEIEYEGFVNGDDENAVMIAPTMTTEATINDTVGTYDIVASGGYAENYTFKYEKGTLTIGEATGGNFYIYGGQSNPYVGNKFTLTAYYNNEKPTVTWSSNNEDVATVNATTGEVEIKSNGTATITATMNDSRFDNTLTATFTLTAAYMPETQEPIYFDELIVEKQVGGAAFTNAVKGMSDGATVKYTSSNTDVATVDELTGEVTIKAAGTTVIKATATKFNCADVYANYTLTVKKIPITVKADDAVLTYGEDFRETTVTVTGATESELTGTLQFTTKYAEGKGVGEYDVTPYGLTSDKYDITFESGTITVNEKELSLSDFVIGAESKTYDNTTDVVIEAYVNSSALVGSDNLRAEISGSFADKNAGEDKDVSFEITSVSGRGFENYVLAGGKITGTVNADITPAKVTFFVSEETTRSYDGNAQKVDISAMALGNVFAESNYTVYYQAEGEEKTTTPTDAGEYEVTVELTDNSGNYVAVQPTAKLVISVDSSANLYIKGSNKNVTVDDEFTLYAYYGNQTPTVTWASDNTDVATVDAETGAVTILKSGTAKITATINDANYAGESAEFELTAAKKRINIKVPASELVKTYNGQEQKINFTSSDIDLEAKVVTVNASYVLISDSDVTTPVQAGTYTVSYEVDDERYIADGNATLTINKANVVVKAKDISKVYGDEPLYELEIVSGSEIATVDDIAPLAQYTSDGAAKTAGVGTYDITVTLTTDNDDNRTFTVSDTKGVMTVEKAPLTVTVKNVTREYGAENPTLEVEYTGFKNEENENTENIFTGELVLTYDESINAETEVGVYENKTTASGIEAANYEITFVQGNVTITKIGVTVSAGTSRSSYLTVKLDKAIEGLGTTNFEVKNGEEIITLTSVTASSDNKTYTLKGSFSTSVTYTVTPNLTGSTSEPTHEITSEPLSIKPSTSGGGGGGGGSATATYTVKFETNDGSKVDSIKVTKNKTVTKPADPTKDGYTFDGWYTDKELTKAYDFDTKVTKAITLYAKWTEVKTEEPDDNKPGTSDMECDGTIADDCPSLDFTDLDVKAWYHLNVDYVLENGLFKGTTETTFAPNDNLTRAMLVTVLYRAEGAPATNRSIPFADVDMGSYYANAVIWAQQNGIVKGVSETEFAPNDNITREQIAAILYRYAIYKGMDAVNLSENLSFTDADEISEYAISALNWAVGTGLIKGYEDNTVRPLNNATRAEAAALLQRFIEANK